MAMVYVTHDLAVVARMADRIVVMYAGPRSSRTAPAAEVIERPRHPYTRALVAAIPDFRHSAPLRGIPGVSVGVGEWPAGCALRAALRARGRALRRGAAGARRRRARPRRPLLRWTTRSTSPSALTSTLRARPAAAATAPLLEVTELEAALSLEPLGRAPPWSTCRSRSSRGGASRSWASRAAARPRSAAASPASTCRPAARSCSRARLVADAARSARSRCGGGSRSCSRTRSSRSTRASRCAARSCGRCACSGACSRARGRARGRRAARARAAAHAPGASASRSSSPAASGSGSRSPAPWPRSPTC